MRIFLSLLALFGLTAGAAAQELFTDVDFDFSFDVPAGMVKATAEQQAAASGQPLETFANTPRAETETGQTSHLHVWRDVTGRDRLLELLIADGDLPFTSPEQFESAVAQKGVEVEKRVPLQKPEFRPGMSMEGPRTRPDGALLRQLSVYYPMPGASPRWAVLRMECLEGDWNLMEPAFMDVLRSVNYPLPERPAGAGGGRAPGGRGRTPPAGAAAPVEERWDSLEVTGSLVLAAVLLIGMFLGGRASPA
jgi:hypothetical protein